MLRPEVEILVWDFKEKCFHPSVFPTGKRTILSPGDLQIKTFYHQCRNDKIVIITVLRCKHVLAGILFCGISEHQEGGTGHRRARSCFKKREALFKKRTNKKPQLFQSSAARRTRCHRCISKTCISIWTREFQSLIGTKPWCGAGIGDRGLECPRCSSINCRDPS